MANFKKLGIGFVVLLVLFFSFTFFYYNGHRAPVMYGFIVGPAISVFGWVSADELYEMYPDLEAAPLAPGDFANPATPGGFPQASQPQGADQMLPSVMGAEVLDRFKRVQAGITYFPRPVPLFLPMLGAFGAGFLLSTVFGFITSFKKNREIGRLKRRTKNLQQEVATLRSIPLREQTLSPASATGADVPSAAGEDSSGS